MAQGVYIHSFFSSVYLSLLTMKKVGKLISYEARPASILTLYTQVAITDSLDFEAVARDFASTNTR